MTASQQRMLVVGCGSIGRRHLQNLLALGQRDIRLVETDPKTLARTCQEFGLQGWSDLNEAVAWGPTAAIVATPTASHVPTALTLARAGCHLLIEKPLSDALEGTEELVRLSQAQRLITLVGCNMRFHPGPARVKAVIQSGELGRLLGARLEVGSYLPDWHPGTDYRRSYSARKELGGGCVLDAIHELDLACWLFGWPSEVVAMTRPGQTLGIETEELGEILLRYEDDRICSVHQDYVQRWRQRRCEIIGERGTVAWESRQRAVSQMMGGAAQPSRWEYKHDPNAMYREELGHFLTCLQTGMPSCADVEWGLQMTTVALLAKQSAQDRQVIAIPSPVPWSL